MSSTNYPNIKLKTSAFPFWVNRKTFDGFSNIEHPFGHPFLFAHDRERSLPLSLSLSHSLSLLLEVM